MPKQRKENDKKSKATKIKSAATVKEKKKTGVPSAYADKVKPFLQDIERYARCGVTEGELCAFYGVGKTQWAKYKKDNPELSETLYKAKAELKTDLINKSYNVAMGYDYEEETTVTLKDKQGNVTGSKTTKFRRHAKADAGMIQFLLINRYPSEYARDPQAIELRKKALELAKEGKISSETLEGI